MSQPPRRLARRWSMMVAIVLFSSPLAFTIADGAVGMLAAGRPAIATRSSFRRGAALTTCSNSLDAMSPCGGTITVAANTTGSRTYRYDNKNTFESVGAGVTCTPIAPVTSCTASPASFTVAPGGSKSFAVQFSAANGGTGKLARNIRLGGDRTRCGYSAV